MKVIFKILAGISTILLADYLMESVSIKKLPENSSFLIFNFPVYYWKIVILAGAILGLLSYILKPILDLITLPLRVLSLGLFGIILNMALVWLVDILFPELAMFGIVALFWVTLIFYLIDRFFLFFYSKIKKIF